MSDVAEGGSAKHRSPPFPYIGLQRAIERAGQMFAVERDHPALVGVVAKAWGYSANSSGAIQTAAALKHFGLVEDEGSGEKRKIRLTKLGLRLVLDKRPDSPERQDALKSAALMPKIHRELWDKYRGAPPSTDTLKSLLTFERRLAGLASFSDQSANELIEEYIGTLTFAGLMGTPEQPIDDPFGLDLPGDMNTELRENRALVPVQQAPAPAVLPAAPQRGVPLMEAERIVFTEEGGPNQYVKLVASGPLDESLLDAISNYVERQKRRLEQMKDMLN
ncbi:hypothetical protein ACE7GA_05620 [Roseomonas sp. CCTCC AB2023176]|uniref:hypothetical protein n=1 Tax=Roseomonas sp. CCTCC AB2023176 TaxID=3342640 RepID=UPI0035DDAD16